jgi:hypothetical protein
MTTNSILNYIITFGFEPLCRSLSPSLSPAPSLSRSPHLACLPPCLLHSLFLMAALAATARSHDLPCSLGLHAAAQGFCWSWRTNSTRILSRIGTSRKVVTSKMQSLPTTGPLCSFPPLRLVLFTCSWCFIVTLLGSLMHQ